MDNRWSMTWDGSWWFHDIESKIMIQSLLLSLHHVTVALISFEKNSRQKIGEENSFTAKKWVIHLLCLHWDEMG